MNQMEIIRHLAAREFDDLDRLRSRIGNEQFYDNVGDAVYRLIRVGERVAFLKGAGLSACAALVAFYFGFVK